MRKMQSTVYGETYPHVSGLILNLLLSEEIESVHGVTVSGNWVTVYRGQPERAWTSFEQTPRLSSLWVGGAHPSFP